jgi:hypothetical protein
MANKPATGIKKLPIEFDITEFKQYILSLDESAWNEWVERQKPLRDKGNYGVHSNTHSLKVCWVPLTLPDTRMSYVQTNSKYYKKVFDFFSDVFSQVEAMYNGKIYRMIIVRLAANSTVGLHKDSGYSLENHHRFHLPISTHENCIFICGNDKINMVEGSIYEINNQLDHSVDNNGNARIHMIFDIAENNLIKE